MIEAMGGYRAVCQGVGFADRSDRARLDVLGPDRAKFLHNLTTNDVKRLADGRGHESFVTSLQGKTLGYVSLLGCADRILLRSDGGALTSLLPHLEKYGLFDDVQLEDVSATTFEYHLAGPGAEGLIERAGAGMPASGDLDHRATQVAGLDVRIVRESPSGRPGLTVIGAIADAAAIGAFLHDPIRSAGLVDVSPEEFEILRIEAGTPVFGRDVSPDNLPQEVGRDARTISFVKGCYLGQETVARIDALGHVNRVFKGLRLLEKAPSPAVGAALEIDGKRVGTVTSVAFSPGWDVPVALGYVRASHAKPETTVGVQTPDGIRAAVLCDLPMSPPERH